MALTPYSSEEKPIAGEPEADFARKAQNKVYADARMVDEINALADLENASTSCTSASSNSLTAGDKTFTVPTGLGWASGIAGVAAVTGSSTQYAPFICKSYSGSTLIITFGTPVGSGTFTTWTITKSNNSANTALLTTNTFIGTQNFAEGASVASAATVNLIALTDGNLRALTGVTPINAWTIANGAEHNLIYTGAGLTLNYSSTTNRLNSGGANLALATNDRLRVYSRGGVVNVEVTKDNGCAILSQDIKSLAAVSNTPANGVTITYPAGTLDFRSTTLSSGAPVTRSILAPISLVISSGSTLGAVNNVSSRIAVLAIDNAGTVELAAVNLSSGLNLDETGLISTTAEGGAGGADSASVIYSTAARSNVAYRVIGFYDETQTTAGTHSAALTLVQGLGGKAGLSQLSVFQAIATTSGTAHDFTGIPAGAKKIRLSFAGVSTGGTSNILVQAIVGGSPVTSGYVSTGIRTGNANTTGGGNATNGFMINYTLATHVLSGSMDITNVTGNTWASSHSGKILTDTAVHGGGDIALAGVLTGLRVTSVLGDTFDAGQIGLIYETA